MALYVDGFLLPVPKKNLTAYRRLSQEAGKVWRKHGAIEYRECVGDDLRTKGTASFAGRAGTKTGEAVIFSWITYKSRAHRDRVNAKVMKDPRIGGMCDPKDMPFDCNRMLYGGFKTIVEA